MSSLMLLPLSPWNFYNREDRGLLVDNLGSVFAYHFENATNEFCAAPAIRFRWTLTFCLLVEEPFVDFYPLKAGLLDSLYASLTVHIAAILLVDSFQDGELVLRLV